MTEKAIKSLKAKSKHLKFKNSNAQQKAIESDSDISEPDVSAKGQKMDKKALKQISTEVTDLLASLKKEHGMEVDAGNKLPIKKEKKFEKPNKIKKDGKNVQNVAADEVKKEKKLEPKPDKPKQNENKKQKQVKANAVSVKKENDTSNGVQAQENSPKKKKNKNKNKKRAADDTEANDDEPQVKKVKETPNQNQNKNKKQKQNKLKPTAKKNQPSEDATEKQADDDDDENENENENEEKKEYYLKDATPVFVGNLPTNIKRTKLLKLFKKFGKVLSIRFRTNKGKSYYKKSQLDKVPHLIAFVYLDSKQAAEASLKLDGHTLGENVISVDLDSKEKTVVKPQTTVVVGNLKYAVTEHILREAFKCCGEIEHVRTVQSLKGCNGVAFVRFAKPESCALALKLNGTSILDREIRVEKYTPNFAEKKGKKEKTPKPQKLGKNKKNANKPGAKEGGKPSDSKDGEKKKKKEFIGVKSNDAKKNLNKKKKKNKLSDEKRLAKKVAPKQEKATA